MSDEPIAEKPGIIQRGAAALAALWGRGVDLLTPPLCLTCSASVDRGAGLCVPCWQKLRQIAPPVCDVLGTPFAYDEGEGALSAAAIANPPHWSKGRAAVVFDENSRRLVHHLKYADRQDAGLAMARMMAAAGAELLTTCDIIVPVPLHRFRLWRRRFNQAALLAQQLSQSSGKPCFTDLLVRPVATRSQVGLEADARWRNVRKAFAVVPEKSHHVFGKRVLLVDDVRTTGATANACAETLLAAGAGAVDVLCFALVLEPSRLHIDT